MRAWALRKVVSVIPSRYLPAGSEASTDGARGAEGISPTIAGKSVVAVGPLPNLNPSELWWITPWNRHETELRRRWYLSFRARFGCRRFVHYRGAFHNRLRFHNRGSDRRGGF
jgi:hypothetical protein